MRVEAVEDVSTLQPAQARLLQQGIEDGWFDDDDSRKLVAYRVIDPGGRRRTLVAPRNPAVKPGSVVICTGWARTAFEASVGGPADHVELHLAARLEPHDLDI